MLNAADVTPQELIRAQFLLLKIKKYRMWQLNPHTWRMFVPKNNIYNNYA